MGYLVSVLLASIIIQLGKEVLWHRKMNFCGWFRLRYRLFYSLFFLIFFFIFLKKINYHVLMVANGNKRMED